MTDDLDDAARERADQVREKRHERADPEGRIGRVRSQGDPPEALDLPEPSVGAVDLPTALREEAETTRKKLTYGLSEEFDVELDAEEQYWPLVVHLGVERLKGMWLEEVERAIETTEGIDPPE